MLTIFAWRELTVAGNKTRACLFISLAAGLLQQLGMFDWTELYISKTRHTPYHRTQVAALWAFSHVYRICTAVYGTPSTIRWQRICIPRYASLFESVGLETMTIEGLYFDHLWSGPYDSARGIICTLFTPFSSALGKRPNHRLHFSIAVRRL